MQLTAYHDEAGALIALIARPDDAPPIFLEMDDRAARRIDVEAPELRGHLEPEETHERLSELMSTRRVDISADPPGLADCR